LRRFSGMLCEYAERLGETPEGAALSEKHRHERRRFGRRLCSYCHQPI
jgi:hypothetical protein